MLKSQILVILKYAKILVGSMQNVNKRKMRQALSINETDVVLFTVHS